MLRRLVLAAPVLLIAGCMPPAPSNLAQTSVVFFVADSAGLDDPALATIRQAAAIANANPSAPVQVRGFAAPDTGTAEFNRALAQARAQNVADALVSAGVPKGRIQIASRGAVSFSLMPTESRRVDIVIGG